MLRGGGSGPPVKSLGCAGLQVLLKEAPNRVYKFCLEASGVFWLDGFQGFHRDVWKTSA